MRMMRLLAMMSIITLASLVYVHQQVELVKLSYSIGIKEKKLKDMLDHKERLGYNISNLEAPSRLEEALLARNVDIAFPKRANVVKVARSRHKSIREERLRSSGLERTFIFSGISEFLSPRAEAQTRER